MMEKVRVIFYADIPMLSTLQDLERRYTQTIANLRRTDLPRQMMEAKDCEITLIAEEINALFNERYLARFAPETTFAQIMASSEDLSDVCEFKPGRYRIVKPQ